MPLPLEPRPLPHVNATREVRLRGRGTARAGALRGGRGGAGRGARRVLWCRQGASRAPSRGRAPREGQSPGGRTGVAGEGDETHTSPPPPAGAAAGLPPPRSGRQPWGKQPQRALRGALKHQCALERLAAHNTQMQLIGIIGQLCSLRPEHEQH